MGTARGRRRPGLSAWSAYMEQNDSAMAEPGRGGYWSKVPERNVCRRPGTGPDVKLVDWDPDAEVKLVTAMLYPYTHLAEEELAARVSQNDGATAHGGDGRNMPATASTGRHRPGRALERSSYRFDVVSDYGAFRDLQRHRLLTIEWQGLTPYHGYTMPEAVAAAGGAEVYEEAMDRSASLYEALGEHFGATVAAYAVTLAHRVRYSVQMNAREAMHMLELRTTPRGPPRVPQGVPERCTT